MNPNKMNALMKMSEIFNEIIKSHAERQGESSEESMGEESMESPDALEELLGGKAEGEVEMKVEVSGDEYKPKGKSQPVKREELEMPAFGPKFARKMK